MLWSYVHFVFIVHFLVWRYLVIAQTSYHWNTVSSLAEWMRCIMHLPLYFLLFYDLFTLLYKIYTMFVCNGDEHWTRKTNINNLFSFLFCLFLFARCQVWILPRYQLMDKWDPSYQPISMRWVHSMNYWSGSYILAQKYQWAAGISIQGSGPDRA